MEIEFSSGFLKKAKKLSSDDKKLLSEKIEWFSKNRNDPKLKAHPLVGKLKGMFAFSITYGKRVVFVYVDDTAVFVDVGSHDEVYR